MSPTNLPELALPSYITKRILLLCDKISHELPDLDHPSLYDTSDKDKLSTVCYGRIISYVALMDTYHQDIRKELVRMMTKIVRVISLETAKRYAHLSKLSLALEQSIEAAEELKSTYEGEWSESTTKDLLEMFVRHVDTLKECASMCMDYV